MALELGHVDVDAMLDGMTVQQFERWKSFFNWRSRKLAEKTSS